MAAQKGRDILIQALISGTYTTIGGMRQKSLQVNEGQVDVTDADSAGWRELLAGASIMSVNVSGNGVFKDTASENYVWTQKLAGAHITAKVTFPGLGTFQGTWQISDLGAQGGHDGEVQFSMALASSGQVTFTAV